MPTKYWDEKEFPLATVSSTAVHFIHNGVIQLRRTDAAGDYSRSGTYKQGEAVLPNFRGTMVTGLYGFQALEFFLTDDGVTPLGTIDYQLSNDDGATWLYWDGGSWTVATLSTHFNDGDTIDANIATFPFVGIRQLKIKSRLTPSADGKATPSLAAAIVNYELLPDYDFKEDFIRSIHAHIAANLKINLSAHMIMQSAGTTIQLLTDFPVSSIRGVFNITDDPDRLTDLYSGIVGTTVTMTGSQAAGKVMQIDYIGGAPPIMVSADEDFNVSQLPLIILNVSAEVEDRSRRTAAKLVEKNVSSNSAKLRNHNLFHRMTVNIDLLDENDIPTRAMADAIARVFQYEDIQLTGIPSFSSLANGEEFVIMGFTPLTDNDRISQGLHVKRVVLDVSGRVPQPDSATVSLVQEIRIAHGTFDEETQ